MLQADAFAVFNRLYAPARRPGPLAEAACLAHGHRRFFVFTDVAAKARGRLPMLAPLALAAVERMDAIFAIERDPNGLGYGCPPRGPTRTPRPDGDRTRDRMLAERARMSCHAELAKAMDYMLKRWPAFERVVHDRRVCLTNKAAERALRGIALGPERVAFRRL